MKKLLVIRLALLALAAVMVSGCVLVPVDDGFQRGKHKERPHRDYHDGPGRHR